jgi:hypothetical protein
MPRDFASAAKDEDLEFLVCRGHPCFMRGLAGLRGRRVFVLSDASENTAGAVSK